MRFLFGRWVEFVILAFAVGALLKGFHLPPPIGRTFLVKGPVRHLEFGAGYANFVVGSTSFESNSYEPDYKRLRQALREEAPAEVIGWSRGAWPDDRSIALEISIDGAPTVSRASRVAWFWLFSIIWLAAGICSTWAAVYTFRRPYSAWENYRTLQKMKEAQTSARRERKT
jgi:hypothetical protein